MKVLHNSLEKANIDSLNTFQLKVWNILCSLFEKLKVSQLSNKSSIGMGLGIDVFLMLKKSDFILYISVTGHDLYINSKYFDIYVYPEIEMDKLELLLKQVMLGEYSIKLGYASNGKLLSKELIFTAKELEEFNESRKYGLFARQVISKKRIGGIQFVDI